MRLHLSSHGRGCTFCATMSLGDLVLHVRNSRSMIYFTSTLFFGLRHRSLVGFCERMPSIFWVRYWVPHVRNSGTIGCNPYRGMTHMLEWSWSKVPESRSTVAPPTFLSRNRRFRTQLPAVSLQIRCPVSTRRHRSKVVCKQENMWNIILHTIPPRVEQPWNVG